MASLTDDSIASIPLREINLIRERLLKVSETIRLQMAAEGQARTRD